MRCSVPHGDRAGTVTNQPTFTEQNPSVKATSFCASQETSAVLEGRSSFSPPKGPPLASAHSQIIPMYSFSSFLPSFLCLQDIIIPSTPRFSKLSLSPSVPSSLKHSAYVFLRSVRDQVSHPNKATCKITVLYTLSFALR